MATFKFKNAEGNWEAVETPGAVKYTEQNLTTDQQAQARTNIGIDETNLIQNVASVDEITESGTYKVNDEMYVSDVKQIEEVREYVPIQYMSNNDFIDSFKVIFDAILFNYASTYGTDVSSYYGDKPAYELYAAQYSPNNGEGVRDLIIIVVNESEIYYGSVQAVNSMGESGESDFVAELDISQVDGTSGVLEITTVSGYLSDIPDELTNNIFVQQITQEASISSTINQVATKEDVETVDNKFSTKADKSHTHTADDVAETNEKKFNYVVNITSEDGVNYTGTVEGLTELYSGLTLTVIPDTNSSNNTPVTLNINGLGEEWVYRYSSDHGSKGNMYTSFCFSANSPYRIYYESEEYGWVLENKQPAAWELEGITSIKNGGTGADNAAAALTNLGVADYVIETGTSGNWVYRKYKSGYVEMRGTFTITVEANTTAKAAYVAFPFTMSSPRVFAQTEQQAWKLTAPIDVGVESTQVKVSYYTTSQTVNTTYTYYLFAVGMIA